MGVLHCIQGQGDATPGLQVGGNGSGDLITRGQVVDRVPWQQTAVTLHWDQGKEHCCSETRVHAKPSSE